jgi:5-(carboxyamino)imidazole ribonucleotide synthase
MNSVILPGASIGVFGSGQLGRMFAIAARRMGYRVHVFSPDRDSPTGQVADVEYSESYDDSAAVERFAKGVDVVTFECENVPATALKCLEGSVPIRPGGDVLRIAQNRLREKTFLQRAGIPVTPFRRIASADDVREAVAAARFPAVLKTAAWGYDGKGQIRVDSGRELESAWDAIDRNEAILEEFVEFEQELSVVAVRGVDGEFAAYEPVGNVHQDHVLDISICPANVRPAVATEAIDITRAIFEALDVVGVMCVEYFLTPGGKLLVNELAPRPHNSGHLTIDAHRTCQFEQQVRAVCGLPLGSTEQLKPAAMANLLGDVWENGEPNWSAVCEMPQVKLHLYGKVEPRVGRKMGHLTAVADSVEEATQLARTARQRLVTHNA